MLATREFAASQAIGNDVNCGMRLMATRLDVEQVKAKSRELESALRHVFFEGGRDIPMTPGQREALVRHDRQGSSPKPEKLREKVFGVPWIFAKK